MGNFAISVENLGKCYQIGELENYYTLRDSLTDIVKYPFKLISKNSEIKKKPEIEFIWALKDINFEVKHGEIIGIIGRNGAGKSTLLKILSRITTPTEGRVKINGRVGSLLEVGTGFHPELTGRENIYLNGSILGMSKKEIERKFDEIVDFAEIERFLDTPVKRYSSGMYVRLAFAVAAHLEPEILIIDEVLAVGDISFQKKCLGKMEDVSSEGRTILFVSHNMAAINNICSKALLLIDGKICNAGEVMKITNEYIKSSYNDSDNKSNLLPYYNSKHGIGINDCNIELVENEYLDLKINIEIESKNGIKNIGVGINIIGSDGYKIASVSPGTTNYVISSINGIIECKFTCREINKYISGGEYFVDFWLSRPRTEYLFRIEKIANFSITQKDIYKNGIYYEYSKHGPIPLIFDFMYEEDT